MGRIFACKYGMEHQKKAAPYFEYYYFHRNGCPCLSAPAGRYPTFYAADIRRRKGCGQEIAFSLSAERYLHAIFGHTRLLAGAGFLEILSAGRKSGAISPGGTAHALVPGTCRTTVDGGHRALPGRKGGGK